jgi:translation initiation factor eIF-2B subunit gamma
LTCTVLCPPKRDIFASALARSTTASLAATSGLDRNIYDSPSSDQHTSLPPTLAATPNGVVSPSGVDQLSTSGILARIHTSEKPPRTRQKPNWKCQAVIVAPELRQAAPAASGKGKDKAKTAPIEPAYLIRANSLAGYWELNRRFLRTMPPTINVQPPPATPATSQDAVMGQAGQVGPPIATTAQISPDSLLGEGTRVGDRASIKKCVVGRHCNIGRGAKLTGCVLWDFVTVEEKWVNLAEPGFVLMTALESKTQYFVPT